MKRDLVHQFLSFLGAGAIATTCHYAVLVALVEVANVVPVSASALGALTGAAISYYLNRNFTFHSKADHRKTAPKFFAVALLAIVINTALMVVFTIWLLIPYFLAQVLTTGLLIIITFGLNKLWSFKE